MNKTLEIGKNYAAIFGYGDDCQMIYRGGSMWECRKGDMMKTVESAAAVAKAAEYINRPAVRMGM